MRIEYLTEISSSYPFALILVQTTFHPSYTTSPRSSSERCRRLQHSPQGRSTCPGVVRASKAQDFRKRTATKGRRTGPKHSFCWELQALLLFLALAFDFYECHKLNLGVFWSTRRSTPNQGQPLRRKWKPRRTILAHRRANLSFGDSCLPFALSICLGMPREDEKAYRVPHGFLAPPESSECSNQFVTATLESSQPNRLNLPVPGSIRHRDRCDTSAAQPLISLSGMSILFLAFWEAASHRLATCPNLVVYFYVLDDEARCNSAPSSIVKRHNSDNALWWMELDPPSAKLAGFQKRPFTVFVGQTHITMGSVFEKVQSLELCKMIYAHSVARRVGFEAVDPTLSSRSRILERDKHVARALFSDDCATDAAHSSIHSGISVCFTDGREVGLLLYSDFSAFLSLGGLSWAMHPVWGRVDHLRAQMG
ncbi:hypothetical protein M407DRAFT_210484 [Tulasnella calospora MUT 4182]|uniref:Uncharacterized protein n=1 Tax=Tulasnella calospora MUT 4182 TaxID=1051891 RepID=A0A0C3QKI2_9AGAM|nr:hypothetical protein M407DRAFT_210484 [Tulasnella calospora MUT 4182]